MFTAYHPMTESELMEKCRLSLKRRLQRDGITCEAVPQVFDQTAPAPVPPPRDPVQETRRMRSLRTCSLPSLYERPRHKPPADTGAFVPSMAARLDNDPNLTDGARRCARKIAEETYRRDRENRSLQVTVTYLAKALKRSTRTIQRYLRMLEREGYLRIQVVSGWRSRLCIGLVIQLMTPIFPRHHREKWPEKKNRRKPGATKESVNKRNIYLDSYNPRFRTQHDPRSRHYERAVWAEKCSAGVCRALVRTVGSLETNPKGPSRGDAIAGGAF